MFGRGTSNDDEPEPEPEEPEQSEEPPEPPSVTLRKEKEVTYRYTEHEATAGFSDGTTRDFTFDALSETNAAYVLKNYAEFGVDHYNSLGPQKVRKTATLVKRNLNFLETTNRIERTESEEIDETFEDVPLPKAMYHVENKPDEYSFDESEVSDDALEAWEPNKHA